MNKLIISLVLIMLLFVSNWLSFSYGRYIEVKEMLAFETEFNSLSIRIYEDLVQLLETEDTEEAMRRIKSSTLMSQTIIDVAAENLSNICYIDAVLMR